jgi:NRAMP (natural resistance-associated macrophage protein)-like metal ion transporter
VRAPSPRALLKVLGPGLIAGAADDDPTGIATYAQAGAQTGYGLLWTALLTLPMMLSVQYISAKIALVRGEGLAAVLKKEYPRPIFYSVVCGLLVANGVMAGADIAAVAAAINLLVPIPVNLLIVPITLGLLGFLIWGKFRLIEQTFKWLALALVAYIVASFFAKPHLAAVLQGTFIPRMQFNRDFLILLLAVLGGNVSPYLFFWQADLEASKEETENGASPAEGGLGVKLRLAAVDTAVGMAFSNAVIFFIEVATAATLFRAGQHNVFSAVEAAQALRPFLRRAATFAWAIGMIGSGLLAVPALAGTIAQAVATAFGWHRGLEQKLGQASGFYAVLTGVLLVSMLMNFLRINFVQALVYAAAVNGFLAPPLIVLLLHVANKDSVMAEHTNGPWLNLFAWATAGLMSLAAIGLVLTFV